MRKSDELANPDSCLNRAHPDEPIFVLRAQDVISPMLVDLWASVAAVLGCGTAKVAEARRLAQQMRDWGTKKSPD